jgi:hemoglobin
MAMEITDVIKGEKVNFKNPSKRFYEAIGGEDGMRQLMFSFYDKIYESEISHFFPQEEEEFEKIKIKNTKFFIQICGGPKVYENEAKGMNLDEFMIRVHDDFSINEKARIEWLGTIKEALDEVKDIEEEILKDFWDYLDQFSKLTVNSFSDGSTYYAAYTQASEEK